MYLLKGHLAHLRKVLRGRGASVDDAEDLVQEAILRLHAYMSSGGQVRDQDAFLMRTALNLAVDARRHSRSELYESHSVEELEVFDNGPTPDEVFAAEQRLLKIKEALDRVNRKTREVFLMHRLQGFSYAEIASHFRISVSMVEKHVASAVTVLAIERQRE